MVPLVSDTVWIYAVGLSWLLLVIMNINNTLNNKVIILLVYSLLCISFVKEKSKLLNFSSEKKLIKSVKHFTDSTKLFLQYGREYDLEVSSKSIRTVTGSSTSKAASYSYFKLGVDFIYSKYARLVPNNDFTDVETFDEKISFQINIRSHSKVPVYTLLADQSKFKELNELEINGRWVEFVESKDDKHFFYNLIA